tara:strand:- start:27057 stop:29147 length:2091 start_codon:yes stop_codon:yes gene_type:complete
MLLSSSIVLNTSPFFLVFFFVVSLFLSFILYRNHKSYLNISIYLRILLFSLRTISLFLLFCLLLQPVINIKEKIIERPCLVLLQDNSSSILLTKDSTFYKQKYFNFIDSILKKKSTKFDVISFDNELKSGFSDFNGRATNFNLVLNHVSDFYSNTNVSGYILFSDGIHNQGLNPIYQKYNLNAPLYTILTGDTTKKTDAFVSSIYSNKLNYLGNKIPIEVVVKSVELHDTQLILDLLGDSHDSMKDSIYASKKINVLGNNFIETTQFYISPTKPGLNKFVVNLKSNSLEDNYNNNNKTFFLDVIDDRKKIIILFRNPHPDIAAIKESLDKNDQYKIETRWVENLNTSDYNVYKDFDLIITHQLDLNSYNNIELFKNKPVLHFVGPNSDINKIEKFGYLSFEDKNLSFDLSRVSINDNFTAFAIDSITDFINNSDPIPVLSNNYEVFHPHKILIYKQVGSIQTTYPVLLFIENIVPSAFFFAEGIWRWKLNDFYLHENHKYFNQFINQIITFLFTDQKTKRFLIDYKKVQEKQDQVYFQAELYDKNFQLTTDYDIDFQLTDSLNKSFNFKFSPNQDTYDLNLNLNSGDYRFTSSVKIGDEILTENGTFVVSDFSLEHQNKVADYHFLNNLSFLNQGFTTSIDSLDFLLDEIIQSNHAKSKINYTNTYKPLINYTMIFLFIVFLIFFEWFLRRRYINY